MTSADIERAIAAIEESRSTHVEWLGHPVECADCAAAPPRQLVGDDEHHRGCIEDYDHVLWVLRTLARDTEQMVRTASGTVLPRRVAPQPILPIHDGGDCGPCVLGGALGWSAAEVYERLAEGKTDALSWSGMERLLWRAHGLGLLEFIADTPSWHVPDAVRTWGSPSWQQSVPWGRYVAMAIDAGYYGLAAVDSRRGGGWGAGMDHWVLLAGWRRREEPVVLDGKQVGQRVVLELLASNSSTTVGQPEEWVDVLDFLRQWGGFNVLLARPTEKT